MERAAEQMREAIEQVAHANACGEFFAAAEGLGGTAMSGCQQEAQSGDGHG